MLNVFYSINLKQKVYAQKKYFILCKSLKIILIMKLIVYESLYPVLNNYLCYFSYITMVLISYVQLTQMNIISDVGNDVTELQFLFIYNTHYQLPTVIISVNSCYQLLSNLLDLKLNKQAMAAASIYYLLLLLKENLPCS